MLFEVKNLEDLADIRSKNYIYFFEASRYDQNLDVELPPFTLKLGKTTQTPYARFQSYNKNVNVRNILILKCNNPNAVESLIKMYIKEFLKITPIVGNEYFIIDKILLKKVFASVVTYEKEEEEEDIHIDSTNQISILGKIHNILNTLNYKEFEKNNKKTKKEMEDEKELLLNTGSEIKKTCKFCNKVFFSYQRRKTHEEICSVKEFREKIFESHNKEINILKELHREELEQKDSKIEELEQKVEFYKLKLELKTKEYEELASKSHSHNIEEKVEKNNIVLDPIDISQVRFDKIVEEKYTYELYKEKNSLKTLLLDLFSNKNGIQVVLSDMSRGTLKYTNLNYKQSRINSEMIHSLILKSSSLKNKLEEFESLFKEEYRSSTLIIKEHLKMIENYFVKKYFKTYIFSEIKFGIT